MDPLEKLVKLVGITEHIDFSGYIKTLSLASINQSGGSLLAREISLYFEPGKKYLRFIRNDYDSENLDWEADFEAEFERSDFSDETEERYANISLEFSIFGFSLVLTPTTQIHYGISTDRKCFYLSIRNDDRMKMILSPEAVGTEELYVKLGN